MCPWAFMQVKKGILFLSLSVSKVCVVPSLGTNIRSLRIYAITTILKTMKLRLCSGRENFVKNFFLDL